MVLVCNFIFILFLILNQTKADVDSDSLPAAIRNSEERLSKGDIYLLENGLNIFVWVGVNVQQGLIQNLFGVSSFSQISNTLVSWIAVQELVSLIVTQNLEQWESKLRK